MAEWLDHCYSFGGLVPSTRQSETPVPDDPMHSSGLGGHHAHVWYTYIPGDKTFIHMRQNF